MNKEHKPQGKSVHADLWGIDSHTLDNVTVLLMLCLSAIEKCGATLARAPIYKKFEPSGVTILCMLEESDLCIHSYPSEGYLAFNCHTCGTTADPEVALKAFIEFLKPHKVNKHVLTRGVES